VKDCAEYVGDPSIENCIVVVHHVDCVEGYVFYSVVLLISEGYW
jgi:hypothetical protein